MYPQQYQDFLEYLDSNPEYLHDLRVRLISEELIALPEQFAELVNTVSELSNTVSELSNTVSKLSNDFQAFVKQTNRRLNTLESDVATLKGSDLERRARDNILNIARDEMDLTRGRILLSRGRDTAQTLLTSITEAEDNGLITEQQADNVLVVRHNHPGPENHRQGMGTRRIPRSPAPSGRTTYKEPPNGRRQWLPPPGNLPWPPWSARESGPSKRRWPRSPESGFSSQPCSGRKIRAPGKRSSNARFCHSGGGRNPQVVKFKKLSLPKRVWIPVFTGMTVNLTTPPEQRGEPGRFAPVRSETLVHKRRLNPKRMETANVRRRSTSPPAAEPVSREAETGKKSLVPLY